MRVLPRRASNVVHPWRIFRHHRGRRSTGRSRTDSLADGTLFPVGAHADDALMASLLTLSDVMGTGHHAAIIASVTPGKSAAVVGDGAVGLCGVIAAKRLGAEQIIILGRHADRIALARDFGATDVVSERGDAAVERVRELTGGYGVHSVLECVGLEQAVNTAISIARPGGAVGRVGVPQEQTIPGSEPAFYNNVPSAAGLLRCVLISRTFCQTFLRARSSPAACSIGPSALTAFRTVTGR